MNGAMEFDPIGVGMAAERLDALADRLDGNLRQSSRSMTVVPAAVDEVSQRAARTFNDVSADYQRGYAAGVHELRKLAANLRSHAQTVGYSEADNAAGFRKL